MRDPCASEYLPSMYRWQVMDMYDHATRTLAGNLAVAGALCAAYEIGIDASDDVYWGDRHWFPGCQREAPHD